MLKVTKFNGLTQCVQCLVEEYTEGTQDKSPSRSLRLKIGAETQDIEATGDVDHKSQTSDD